MAQQTTPKKRSTPKTSLPVKPASNGKLQRRNASTSERTWQETKSAATRTQILEAALDCFYELGYARTTTEQVAQKAGVSRGAMLHHFPSRFELIHGAIDHLSAKRLATFERVELRIQRNVEQTQVAEGIDAYWRQLNSKPFVVFHELQVAARTDPELRKILLPAIREFDARWLHMSANVFPDLSHSRNFMLANFLTLFLLEGMAVNQFTRRSGKWANIVLDDLKARLQELFGDVVGVSTRATTPRQLLPQRRRTTSNSTNEGPT